MNQMITQTKIVMPRRRSDLISRPRLLKLMSEQLERKLLLIIAPAGYGKTSLLIDFAHEIEGPVCWYSVGQLEQDFHRFAAYFIATIQRQYSDFGAESNAALQNLMTGNGQVEQLVATIVNELYDQVAGQLFIVIDDYHLVSGCAEIDTFISTFVSQCGDNCHLILASRTLLNLPDLPLLVARLQVWGIGLEELAFQTDELQGLLQQSFDLKVNDTTALEMVDASEGWITGLLLSTQAMQTNVAEQSRLIRASGVGLYEYLAQEVFEQQEPGIQEFLLRTSLLEEFNIELCISVFEPLWYAEGTSWQPYFEALLANNLFVVPVGEDGSWLRYHHLFQEFLQKRLAENSPQEFQNILERVADTFFERKEWERAYQLYQRAGTQNAVADLVEVAGASLLKADRNQLLGQWLDALDDNVVERRPILGSLKGCIAVLRGSATTGVTFLSKAIEIFSVDRHHFQQAVSLYQRAVAHRFTGDYQATINDADEALRLLELVQENSLYATDHEVIEVQADALRAKGVGLRMAGQPELSVELLQTALEKYRTIQNTHYIAKALHDIATGHMDLGRYAEAIHGFLESYEVWREFHNVARQAHTLNNLGVVYHLLGRYFEAHGAFTKAIEYAQRSADTSIVILAQISMGDLLTDLGLYEKATTVYDQVNKNSAQIGEQFLELYLTLARAMLACTASDWNSAYKLLDAAGHAVLVKRSSYEWGLYRLAMGRFYLSQQDPQRATTPLEDAIESFKEGKRRSEEATARLLAAVAYHQTGDIERAITHISELTSVTSDFESQQPLIAVARHVEPELEKLAQKVAGATQAAPDQEGGSYIESLLKQVSEFNQKLPSIQASIENSTSGTSNSRQIAEQKATCATVPVLQIRTFGRVEVRQNGELISSGEWQSQTARDLFLCLVAHPDGLTKEEIGTHFWPDSAPAQLKIRFKNAIYRLRNAVGAEKVIFKKNVYQFDRSLDYECDIEQFIAQVVLANEANSIEAEQTAYEAAMNIYTGDYLPGIDVMWAWLERERLQKIFLEASTRLAEIYLERGQHSDALERCQQILAVDPCLEEAHRLSMRTYATMGNRAAVVRQYEQCCSVLQEEIDVPPSEQTEELFNMLMK